MRFIFILLAFLYPSISNGQANFTAPDTVCVNTPVSIINTSPPAFTYYWNFCIADIANTPPTGVNLGNPNGALNTPVFMDYVQVNNNYYGFVVNLNTNRLVRLDFGNSLLNSPTSTILGDFGGIIPLNAEGLQIVFNEGKWYAIIVGGAQSISTGPRILKIDFGADITNTSPIATNWGNIGGLTYPVDLHIFKENNNWYGFSVNAESNTITRFNFGSSFDQTPTGTNLGNIGNLNYPTGIYAINNGGNWHVFITNAGGGGINSQGSSLTRLDFGTSLLNSPTGVNLGNLNNTLRSPRDLYILNFCNQLIGFITNFSTENDIVRVNFNNSITNNPSSTSLGNIGNANFPHSISKLFRVDADLYGFVTNALNNTITRLKFTGCNNSSIPNASVRNAPDITYSSPGNYNINLTIDDGLPTQSSFCRNVVVVPKLQHSLTKNLSFCSGDSILLESNYSSRNKWNTNANSKSIYVKAEGTYWVETSNGACTNRDSFVVSIKPAPFQVNLGKDTIICPSTVLVLDAGNSGASYLWNNGATSKSINVKDPGNYYVIVELNSCINTDTIKVDISTPGIIVSKDTAICKNSSVQLFSAGGISYKWTPTSGINSSTDQNPIVTAFTKTTYYLTATDINSCINTDSVTIDVLPEPVYEISNPSSVCLNDSVQLNATGGTSYSWEPSHSLNNNSSSNPKASPKITTTYSVLVTDKCNNSKTLSTIISVLSNPDIKISKSNDVDCITPVSQLEATGGVRYNWNPAIHINSATLNNPIVYPPVNTWYSVDVYGQNGCKTTDSILVLSSYAGDGKFYIPNAFTPNNDGKNDCFSMKYLGDPEIFELTIYNRWGQQVFHSTNTTNCWNGTFHGKLQPAGVFVYQLKVKSECTNGLFEKQGFVTLIN